MVRRIPQRVEGDEGEVRALLWLDGAEQPVLATSTDFRLVFGDPRRATWLPEGWWMELYPTGLELPNLEPWFRYLMECINSKIPDRDEYVFEVGEEGMGEPSAPTIRGMVAHAHMILRYHGPAGGPEEPEEPLDRAGYLVHARKVWDYLRKSLAKVPFAADNAGQGESKVDSGEQKTLPPDDWKPLVPGHF
jgi:hypothetical protein